MTWFESISSRGSSPHLLFKTTDFQLKNPKKILIFCLIFGCSVPGLDTPLTDSLRKAALRSTFENKRWPVYHLVCPAFLEKAGKFCVSLLLSVSSDYSLTPSVREFDSCWFLHLGCLWGCTVERQNLHCLPELMHLWSEEGLGVREAACFFTLFSLLP